MKSLLTYKPLDYLETLPQASKAAAIQALSAGRDPMEVGFHLAAQPSEGLAAKGGSAWPPDLWPRIVRELRLLICTDDPKYAEWRKRAKEEGTTTAKAVVFLASNAIAASVGIVPALCTPFVAIVLAAVAKMGIEGWCKATEQSPPAPLVS